MPTTAEEQAEQAGELASLMSMPRESNPFDGITENHLWDCWDGGFTKGRRRKIST